MLGLDDFDTHARYRPGLLAILPVPITAMAIGISTLPIITSLVSLAVAVGLPRLLVQLVRRRGLDAEPGLHAAWGGKPTTRMLRLADSTSPSADKARWRAVLAPAAGVALPSAGDEAANPPAADVLYEQVTGFAREATRGDELLRQELCAYNYERNLVGLQPVAIRVAIAGVAVTAGVLIAAISSDTETITYVVGLIANLVTLIGWWRLPSSDRVRLMADKYALRLFTVATNQLVTHTASQ